MVMAVSEQISQETAQSQRRADASVDLSQEMPPATPNRSAPWKRLKVGNFFGGVNWENKPAPVLAAETQTTTDEAILSTQPLSYRLSVGQFFAAVPWDGNPRMQEATAELPTDLPEIDGEEPAALSIELPDVDEFADGAADAGDPLTLDDFFL